MDRRASVFFVLGYILIMASSTEVPKLKLNNGREIPALALGTYLGYGQDGTIKSIDKQLQRVIERAIDVGYRHFDTAAIYETEAEVGDGIRAKMADGTVTREEVFVTTKLWNTQHRREEVMEAMKESLKRLQLDYVDLFLMHWPMGLNADYTYNNVHYMETWRGMEEAVRLGLARAIGLSNFNQSQIARVIREGEVKPSVLQIEIHPQNIQTDLVEYAKSEDVVVMAYSPFGSLVKRFGIDFPGPKFTDPLLVELAAKYKKTVPQIILGWLVNRGIIPVPKTVNFTRLHENNDIFDVTLTDEEIIKINKYNENKRYTLPSFWQDHPYYPFEKVQNPIASPFGN